MFSTIWNKSVLIKDIRPNRFYLIADLEYLSRTMITYESNLQSREDDIEKDMEEHQKLCDEIMAIQGIEPIEAEIEEVWHCPEDYIFKDENGNVINATKIVLEKKKKEYPKTYEECCKVMNYCCNPAATKTTHKEELIRKGKEMCKKCEIEDDGHIYEYCGQCKLNEFLDLIESEST